LDFPEVQLRLVNLSGQIFSLYEVQSNGKEEYEGRLVPRLEARTTSRAGQVLVVRDPRSKGLIKSFYAPAKGGQIKIP